MRVLCYKNENQLLVKNMARVLRLKAGFFDNLAKNLSPKDLQRAPAIIIGLLNGQSAENIATQLEVEEPSLRAFSSRIRTSLGVLPNNQRSLLIESFRRGTDLEITKIDMDRFNRMRGDFGVALDMIADGIANAEIGKKLGLDMNDTSALITQASSAMTTCKLKRQSLLPALTYRAVDIYKSRQSGDADFLPNVCVEIAGGPN